MTQVTAKVLPVWNLLMEGEGRFVVPWHQRYYDWEEEQIGELLQDISEAFEFDRQSYFVGSIMLIEGEDEWEINDGQQRLITLSLMLAAFCRRFAQSGKFQDRVREIQALRLLFVLPDNTVETLREADRLILRITPPQQDKNRFSSIIRGHNVDANGKMTVAWGKVNRFVTSMKPENISSFFDFLLRKVEIAVLYVPRTEDTNAVFEALNGRGKTLSHLDLIRNHLYSYFSDHEDGERKNTIHECLEQTIMICRRSKKSEEYFRCFFQCQYGFLHKTRFYRETRNKIRDEARDGDGGKYVYNLIQDLSEPPVVELFRNIAANTPDEDFVNSFLIASKSGSKKRNLKVFLSELRGYTVAHPVVFSLLRRFVTESTSNSAQRRAIARKVDQCLSDLSSFIMRVTFCRSKFEPSRYEANFAHCAERITYEEKVEEMSIIEDLHACDELGIMSDKRFEDQLLSVRITNRSSIRQAKRLLFGINAQKQTDANALDFSGCTVEHILPQSDEYRSGWTGFSDVGPDLTDWIQQIGNLTLLGDSDKYSKAQFNSDFESKKIAFMESPFEITREVAKRNSWTPKRVAARSRRLARTASRVWSFSREPDAT